MLPRGAAGIRGKTLILTLAGPSAGTAKSLDAVMSELLGVFSMITG